MKKSGIPANEVDADGDGYPSCRDCDDANPAVHPGAPEICDGLDNDCNGAVDDAPPIQGVSTPSQTRIAWQPSGSGEGSDVLKGSLAALLTGSGDFTASVLLCLANDSSASTVTDAVSTGTGQGFYYLVRGYLCGQAGTYDERAASQRGSRDAPIAASPAACP